MTTLKKLTMLLLASLFTLSLAVQAADDKGEMKDQGSAPATEATAAGTPADENKEGMKEEGKGEMKEGMEEEKKDMK